MLVVNFMLLRQRMKIVPHWQTLHTGTIFKIELNQIINVLWLQKIFYGQRWWWRTFEKIEVETFQTRFRAKDGSWGKNWSTSWTIEVKFSILLQKSNNFVIGDVSEKAGPSATSTPVNNKSDGSIKTPTVKKLLFRSNDSGYESPKTILRTPEAGHVDGTPPLCHCTRNRVSNGIIEEEKNILLLSLFW